MSLFGQLLRREPTETKVADASDLTWTSLMGAPLSKTGATVNVDTALRVSVAWACCQVLCEDVGKVPLKLLQEDEARESKEVARKHAVHKVISRRPNQWQTSMEWRETMLLHALLSKGGYSYINRGANGEVLELLPLMPGNVTPKQDSAWNVWYEVKDAKGKIADVPASRMHVVRGLSWNGVSGLDLMVHGAESLGLSMALEESQARLHGNGARPGGILTTSQTLTQTQIDRIKAQVATNYGGLANAFKTILLDAGLEFKPFAMTGVDSQHLETRRFQIEEICRFFRVFPAMVGFADKTATYASAEAFFTAHVVHSLQPWVTRWEQAIERDLLTEEEVDQLGYRPKFFLNGLMRGDAAARAAFYESAITKGCWMSRNDARRLEDMNPLPGLDEMLLPMNMQEGQKPAGKQDSEDEDDEE
jgi:HK97 family phage portal protein